MNRFAALAAAMFIGLTTAARADERISNFASDIRVARTGALTVTETISVNSGGSAIRHGILRDFPTIYDKQGRRIRVGFDVLSVSLDGHAETYSVEQIADGERVKIGDANTELPSGPHRFTLTYATDRQIGFFGNYDELYWNVTGNFWDFPIDRAEATITLPQGAQILQYRAYTGFEGSTEQNASGTKLSPSAVQFGTTRPLESKQGLTVAIGFSKGAVIPPSAAELRAFYVRDNASLLVACFGLLVLLIYFTTVWYEHARAPRRGTIIPLFAPPKDFSPAAVRFVHRMAYDRKSYAASLVDMAVKDYLKIAEHDHTYTLTRTGKSAGQAGLAHGETAIANILFDGDDTIDLKQVNHRAISASVSALSSSLKNEYERVYFVTNHHWFLGGLAILVATSLASVVFNDQPVPAGMVLLWLSFWSVGVAALLHRTADAWMNGIAGPGSRSANIFGAVIATAFTIPFLGGWVLGFFMLTRAVPLEVMLALSLGGIATYMFYYFLRVPTLAGAKIFDEIDGFRMFLVTAEKDRLEVLNPPNVTPEVFEKFLPYAIALDCENQWSWKFEAEAAKAGVTPATGSGYTPGWYTGDAFSRFEPEGFSEALGTSMAAAAAAAVSAPGSSSGSGGGGSSGGGGGGGGGGGW